MAEDKGEIQIDTGERKTGTMISKVYGTLRIGKKTIYLGTDQEGEFLSSECDQGVSPEALQKYASKLSSKEYDLAQLGYKNVEVFDRVSFQSHYRAGEKSSGYISFSSGSTEVHLSLADFFKGFAGEEPSARLLEFNIPGEKSGLLGLLIRNPAEKDKALLLMFSPNGDNGNSDDLTKAINKTTDNYAKARRQTYFLVSALTFLKPELEGLLMELRENPYYQEAKRGVFKDLMDLWFMANYWDKDLNKAGRNGQREIAKGPEYGFLEFKKIFYTAIGNEKQMAVPPVESKQEVLPVSLSAREGACSPDYARQELGDRYFGVEEVRELEKILRSRLDVNPFVGGFEYLFGKMLSLKNFHFEFDLDNLPPFPYTEADIKLAKKRKETLFLRPPAIKINGKRYPMDIRILSLLFQYELTGMQLSDIDKIIGIENFSTWALDRPYRIKILPGENYEGFKHKIEKEVKDKEKGLKADNISTTTRRRSVSEAVWDELFYLLLFEKMLGGEGVELTSTTILRYSLEGNLYVGVRRGDKPYAFIRQSFSPSISLVLIDERTSLDKLSGLVAR